jgi:hypothetical protein
MSGNLRHQHKQNKLTHIEFGHHFGGLGCNSVGKEKHAGRDVFKNLQLLMNIILAVNDYYFF